MSTPDDSAWIAAAGAPRNFPNPMPHQAAVMVEPADSEPIESAIQGMSSAESVQAADQGQRPSDANGSTAELQAPEEASDEHSAGEHHPAENRSGGLFASPAPAAPEVDSPAPMGRIGAISARAREKAAAKALAEELTPAVGPTGRPIRVIPEPAPLDHHGPARVIAICNQKGGVGKTTSTINLGAALAGYGRRVLVVDLDPQGALSAGLGVPSHQLDRTIYNLMLERSTSIADILVPTQVPGMDLLPANIDLSAAEVQLINEVGREQTLGRALRPVLHDYDYILIDCQPSLGLLTVNALACANAVVMPVAAEYFALRGVALLIDTISKVQDRINPDLSIDGILVTMFDGRTMHSRDVVATLVEQFGDQVYDTVISRTVKFPETTVAGEPITSYAPTSQAAQAYLQLAREVISR